MRERRGLHRKSGVVFNSGFVSTNPETRRRPKDSGVGDAVAEEVEGGEFFDAADDGANEGGGLARVVGDGDFDGGVFLVAFATVKTEAAFGNVFTFDDLFAGGVQADTRGEVDASTDVAPHVLLAAWREGRRGRGGWNFF